MLQLRPFFRTLKDHYPTLISATAACVLTVLIAKLDAPSDSLSHQYYRTLVSAIAGISLFLGVDLIFENQRKHLFRLFGFILLAGLQFWLFEKPSTHVFSAYLSFFVFTHLLVSLAPWIKSRLKLNSDELWEHNWSLLTHVIRIALQIGVLMLGFGAGLWAIDNLFGVKISSTVYVINYSFFGFVMTALLLVTSFKEKTETSWLTNMLNIVTRTALTPVALLYSSICYVYTLKMLFELQWPRGIIGTLVSGLSSVILLGLVAIWPKFQNLELPKWEQKLWQNIFKILLIPQFVLFAAVIRRVWEYGLTDSRTYLLYLSLWGLTLCAYYWNPIKKQLAFIPASLAVIAFVCIGGPLSPVFIGKYSQISRLQNMMADMGLKKQTDGTFKSDTPLEHSQKQKLTEQFQTLCTENGQSTLVQTFEMKMKLSEKDSRWECHVSEDDSQRTELEDIMINLGLQPVGKEVKTAEPQQSETELSYETPTEPSLLRSGFGVYYGTFVSSNVGSHDDTGPIAFKFDSKSGGLSFTFDNQDFQKVDLKPHFQSLVNKKPIELTIEHAMGSVFVRIFSLYGTKTKIEAKPTYIKLFYAFKPSPFWKPSGSKNQN